MDENNRASDTSCHRAGGLRPQPASRSSLSERSSLTQEPKRIQLSRKKGWRMPDNTVKVDRSSGFGNPYRITPGTCVGGERDGKKVWFVETESRAWECQTKAEAAQLAVELFRKGADQPANETYRQRIRLALRGKNLACWCKIGDPCHADVLLVIANRPVCVSDGDAKREDRNGLRPEGMPARPSEGGIRPTSEQMISEGEDEGGIRP